MLATARSARPSVRLCILHVFLLCSYLLVVNGIAASSRSEPNPKDKLARVTMNVYITSIEAGFDSFLEVAIERPE
jgi:hypothetical protein